MRPDRPRNPHFSGSASHVVFRGSDRDVKDTQLARANHNKAPDEPPRAQLATTCRVHPAQHGASSASRAPHVHTTARLRSGKPDQFSVTDVVPAFSVRAYVPGASASSKSTSFASVNCVLPNGRMVFTLLFVKTSSVRLR